MEEKTYPKYTVSKEETTYNALKQIEDNLVGTLIVLHQNKVVGMLTDGDIRKLLIANNMLTIPVKYAMNRNYIFITEDDNQDTINQIFNEHSTIRLLPVINDKGTLLDIKIRPNYL